MAAARPVGMAALATVAGGAHDSGGPNLVGFLRARELGCKTAPSLRNRIVEHRAGAFGRKEWIRHTGFDPGLVKSLPRNIDAVLNAPCPFWEGRKVGETHGLYWIPSEVTSIVDGHVTQVTIRTLANLIPGCRYGYISDRILTELGDVPIEGYWILVSKEVIPGSRNQAYAAHQALVRARPGYEMPRVIEAILMAFLEYQRSGTFPLDRAPWTYTRCSESMNTWPLSVGGFAAIGLDFTFYDHVGIGVLGLRKF